MTKCRDGYHGPYKDSVVILGRSGNQSQIVEAKGSFKPSDSELIEWATGIIELLMVYQYSVSIGIGTAHTFV